MAYDFYLNNILLPVAPAKLQRQINGRNETVDLINNGEVNIIKQAGLTDIKFSALLPNVQYPFASYPDGFYPAEYYLDLLELLKNRVDDKGRYLPFRFVVSRRTGGLEFEGDSFLVTLEDYSITEDAKSEGLDVVVDITLKQYREYGTRTLTTDPQTGAATVEQTRPAENPPTQAAYTVMAGDTLWTIAKKMLGDGSRYPEIYDLNKVQIDAANEGTGNLKNTIYPGQVFSIPQSGGNAI